VTCVSLKIIDSDSKEGKIPKTMAETKSRQAKLAKTFHHHMTEGQSFQGPNAYRRHFYKEVIQLANEVSFCEFPHFGKGDSFQSS
jgi:hypothetical protein